MRRIEQLINDVRFQTNEDSNRFSNIKFNKLFSDAQTEIVRIINVRSSENTFFAKSYVTDIVTNQAEYDLPSDVYARNAINSVLRKLTSGAYYEPLRLVTFKEIGRSAGYIIQDGKIVLSLLPVTAAANGLVVNYTKRIPTSSIRIGKIQSITSGVIALTALGTDEDITLYDDYFCIVDKDGVLIDQEMVIDSYDSVTGNLTTSSTITAPVGSYVTIGGYSSSNSQLPVECEKYMTMFVERMVHYINSSRSDMDAAMIFSDEEKRDITELFADVDNDVKYPPITDSTYLN